MFLVLFSLIIIVCLIYISIVDSLFFSVLISGIISFIFILFYLIFKAPDIALTEIAIGSSVSTLLFVMALLLINNQKINKSYVQNNIRDLDKKIVYLLFSFLLFYFFSDTISELPIEKDETYTMTNLGELYIQKAYQVFKIPSIVTSIIVGFRGIDTMFETLLIITASCVFAKIMRDKDL